MSDYPCQHCRELKVAGPGQTCTSCARRLKTEAQRKRRAEGRPPVQPPAPLTREQKILGLGEEMEKLRFQIDAWRDETVQRQRDMTDAWALLGQLQGELWQLQGKVPA